MSEVTIDVSVRLRGPYSESVAEATLSEKLPGVPVSEPTTQQIEELRHATNRITGDVLGRIDRNLDWYREQAEQREQREQEKLAEEAAVVDE